MNTVKMLYSHWFNRANWPTARQKEVRRESQTERTLGRRRAESPADAEEAGSEWAVLKKGTATLRGRV